MVRQHGERTIRLDSDHRAEDARAIYQAVLAVIGISVRITERDKFFFTAVGVDAKNLVVDLIAHINETIWVPDWSFGKTHPSCNLFEPRILANQLPELLGVCLQFEMPLPFLRKRADNTKQQCQQDRELLFRYYFLPPTLKR